MKFNILKMLGERSDDNKPVEEGEGKKLLEIFRLIKKNMMIMKSVNKKPTGYWKKLLNSKRKGERERIINPIHQNYLPQARF